MFFYILLKIQHSKCSFKILIHLIDFIINSSRLLFIMVSSKFFCMTFAQVFIASKDSFPTIQYNLIMANIDTVTMKNIVKNFEFLILIKIFKRWKEEEIINFYKHSQLISESICLSQIYVLTEITAAKNKCINLMRPHLQNSVNWKY